MGIMKKVGSFLKEKGDNYKRWKSEAPARDEQRIKDLNRKARLAKAESKLLKAKGERNRARKSLVPDGLGNPFGDPFGPGMMQGPARSDVGGQKKKEKYGRPKKVVFY